MRCIVMCSCLSLLMFSCIKTGKPVATNDFPEIVAKDTLTALTVNTSTSYFIYRDQPMGYHYDMIRDFCDRHGLVLKIVTVQNSNQLTELLKQNAGDVITYDMPIESEQKDSVLYCGWNMVTHQVLVQRSEPKDSLVTDVTQLIGKRVTVRQGTKFDTRLRNLNDELGGGIIIDEVNSDSVVLEDIIRDIATGNIDYTISDQHLAQLNRTYYQNLDVSMPVSFEQRTSWVVRKDAPILADSLNAWFVSAGVQPGYQLITKRYFEESKGYIVRSGKPYAEMMAPGVISPYDPYFKQYAKEYNIDWRLLASVGYQESNFNYEGKSWAGAVGIMGLMPATASSMGIESDNIYDPEKNIRAGAAYLRELMNNFSSIKDKNEQIKMALASYNGGIGHVSDARALADKYAANKDVWEGNVEMYIHLKRYEEYYNDPVCKAGYFRGDETINYVREVIARWQYYASKVKA